MDASFGSNAMAFCSALNSDRNKCGQEFTHTHTDVKS